MPKRIRLLLGALLACACALPVLAATPTVDQVYQALRGGNVAQAQQMMTQVLSEYPRSGRAHFVAAEVDARAGNYGLARQELHTAESLDPSLAVKDRRGVQELEQQLGEMPSVGVLAQQTVRSHTSRLGLFLILIGAAVVLWLVLRRRAVAMGYPQYPGQYGSVPPGPAGYSPGGYPGGYMPGGGPGIMGSVASGLAVGAGVAAGEELVRHVIGGGNPGAGGFVAPAEAGSLPDPNADMGGNDFGLSDPGSWDDGSGGGGGGWDGGGGGDGGGDGGGWT